VSHEIDWTVEKLFVAAGTIPIIPRREQTLVLLQSEGTTVVCNL
jgi:hypothetical protein